MTSAEQIPNTPPATTGGSTPPPAAASSTTGTPTGSVGTNPGLTTGAPSDWTAGLNEDTRGWVQLKGFKEPGAVVESYRQLEKLHGVPPSRIIKLPENFDDPQTMGEIYGRLGRPDKPDGYGIKAPEGDSGEFAKWASENFFQAGLSAKQGQALMAKYSEFATQAQKAQADELTAKTVAGQISLKKEWGAAYDQNTKIAARGARSVGVDANTMDAIEMAIGYEKTMKLFQSFGAKTGEDSFVTGNNDGFQVMTPAMAKAKITELQSDPYFAKKYMAGDVGSKKQMEDLHKMAYPEDTQ